MFHLTKEKGTKKKRLGMVLFFEKSNSRVAQIAISHGHHLLSLADRTMHPCSSNIPFSCMSFIHKLLVLHLSIDIKDNPELFLQYLMEHRTLYNPSEKW